MVSGMCASSPTRRLGSAKKKTCALHFGFGPRVGFTEFTVGFRVKVFSKLQRPSGCLCTVNQSGAASFSWSVFVGPDATAKH